ncbi:hypothetical protein [uncultured Mucilaginibacter sp.]|uniref:hypothetical protein n=1 Tax=uncultured Mucilaginibacter sp. TaxID=797541 RepID=UPI0025EFF0C9|nr:hypothetical protein [uncultured Mucilaginibacter sp.]
MSEKNILGFSYKVTGVTLEAIDENLQITQSFATKAVIDIINEKLKLQNFKVDENTLRVKYVNDQLFLEGFATEIKEHKSVGFLSGR